MRNNVTLERGMSVCHLCDEVNIVDNTVLVKSSLSKLVSIELLLVTEYFQTLILFFYT